MNTKTKLTWKKNVSISEILHNQHPNHSLKNKNTQNSTYEYFYSQKIVKCICLKSATNKNLY